jgi:type I restriction enzyme R subunit
MEAGNFDLNNRIISHLRNDIEELPKNSVIVLEAQSDLEVVKNDDYWRIISKEKIDDLRRVMAPVMRAKSQGDFKAIRFEIDVIDMATAHVKKEREKYETLKDAVTEQIKELPLSINIVRKEKDYIESVTRTAWWHKFTYGDLDELVNRLGPLMKYKAMDIPKAGEEKLDLRDEVHEKRYIEFGPEHERLTVKKYRERVEAIIKEMVASDFVLQKLQIGINITEAEVEQLANILESRDPWVTEKLLQHVYDNKRAKFIQFIKFILGTEELKSFTQEVTEAFTAFIAEHNTYSEQQIQFLLTLQTFILRKGTIEKKDLVKEPFTKISPDGIIGIFKQKEIEEILKFAEQLVA